MVVNQGHKNQALPVNLGYVMDNQLCLKSERLTLRPWCDEDLPALFEGFSDPEVMKYWSSAPHKSIEETKAKLNQWCNTRGALELVIESESEVIGRCGYFDSDLGHEIGYLLVRKHWGKGIKTTKKERKNCKRVENNFLFAESLVPFNYFSVTFWDQFSFPPTKEFHLEGLFQIYLKM